nr:hypothetical protein [Clostridia bacterium]
FVGQLDGQLGEGAPVLSELKSVMTGDDYPLIQKDILDAYGTTLGIDVYRNFYILDMDGSFLAGSDEELGQRLEKTPQYAHGHERRQRHRSAAGNRLHRLCVLP